MQGPMHAFVHTRAEMFDRPAPLSGPDSPILSRWALYAAVFFHVRFTKQKKKNTPSAESKVLCTRSRYNGKLKSIANYCPDLGGTIRQGENHRLPPTIWCTRDGGDELQGMVYELLVHV